MGSVLDISTFSAFYTGAWALKFITSVPTSGIMIDMLLSPVVPSTTVLDTGQR